MSGPLKTVADLCDYEEGGGFFRVNLSACTRSTAMLQQQTNKHDDDGDFAVSKASAAYSRCTEINFWWFYFD